MYSSPPAWAQVPDGRGLVPVLVPPMPARLPRKASRGSEKSGRRTFAVPSLAGASGASLGVRGSLVGSPQAGSSSAGSYSSAHGTSGSAEADGGVVLAGHATDKICAIGGSAEQREVLSEFCLQTLVLAGRAGEADEMAALKARGRRLPHWELLRVVVAAAGVGARVAGYVGALQAFRIKAAL
jgi:hypothetical protein